MSTVESAPDDERVGAQQPAQTMVYSSSPSGAAAGQSLPAAARLSTRQRRRPTSRSAARFLRALIDAVLRDDIPGRIERIPEHRDARTEMLTYHILRQTR